MPAPMSDHWYELRWFDTRNRTKRSPSMTVLGDYVIKHGITDYDIVYVRESVVKREGRGA